MSSAPRDFAVGALAFRLDAATGFVRHIRFAGHDVLRGIYPAVRDPDWRTLAPVVMPPTVELSADRVTVQLSARVASGAVDLEWQVEIVAEARGELRYRWRARVRREFSTNRTGLCVLHPAEIAGSPCGVEHADGSSVASWFPQTISPHQPFHNVRAITHVFAERAEAVVRMEGEVFETEDQRNWTDASIKTYCRPLDWPRPYLLKAGGVIEHMVTVTIRGEPRPRNVPIGELRLAGTATPAQLPRIGFTLPGPIPASLRERLRALRPAHVRVETTPAEMPSALPWAREAAEFLDCGLDVAIRGAIESPPAHTQFPPRTCVHLFSDAGNAVSPEVLAAWRRAGFTSIGTGTLSHFTELNRQRPAADADYDFTTFGINAQVHAFDDGSMLETLSQHGVVARHAHAIGAGRPVSVGPIALGPTADSADARLHSGFAARWLLGSIIQLAAAGCVDRATFLQTHGPGGFLREDRVTPAEQLFLLLAGATDSKRVTLEGETSAAIDALLVASADGKQRRLLIGHDADPTLQVEIPFSGLAAELGSEPARFVAGRAALPPRTVWQLHLSA